MKKNILLLLLLNFFLVSVKSQVPSWTWLKKPVHLNDYYIDNGQTITTDENGNSYVAGILAGIGYVGNIYFNIPYGGIYAGGVCLIKYDSSGNALWLRSSAQGGGVSVCHNNLGNIYLTGEFIDTMVLDNDTVISAGWNDFFLAKYDTTGNLHWFKKGGGSSIDRVNGITTDSIGNFYITGYFNDTLIVDNEMLISHGARDIFIAKFNTGGNLIWLKGPGGPWADEGRGIELDHYGNLFVSGICHDSCVFEMDTLFTRGTLFLARFDTSGQLKWMRSNGGANTAAGNDVSTDAYGNCVITGYFADSLMLGNDTIAVGNRKCIFTAKFDSTGSELWVETIIGGLFSNEGYAITIDKQGSSYITGQFSDTVHFGSTILTSYGNFDIIVAKYDPLGNFLWAKHAGGVGAESGQDISTDQYGNCYVTGIGGSDTSYFDTIVNSTMYGSMLYIAKINCMGIQPEISLSGGILHSTLASSYQWFLDGVLIPGATSADYIPTQDGNYTVYARDINGCGSSSIPYNVIGLGMFHPETISKILVYPNPSDDCFKFNYLDNGDEIQTIKIQNCLSQEIIATNREQVDMTKFARGIYFYSVSTSKGKIFNGTIIKK
jgi:hypothetical protein